MFNRYFRDASSPHDDNYFALLVHHIGYVGSFRNGQSYEEVIGLRRIQFYDFA